MRSATIARPSAVDRRRRAACALASSGELAAEIIPGMLPVHRRHDLAMAFLADRWFRQRGAEAGALARELRLAGLFQEHADARGLRHRGAAEGDAVIAHQHRERSAERMCERDALF